VSTCLAVSNPQRIATNSVLLMPEVPFITVSNPQRIATNPSSSSCSCSPEREFQTLKGSLQTKGAENELFDWK